MMYLNNKSSRLNTVVFFMLLTTSVVCSAEETDEGVAIESSEIIQEADEFLQYLYNRPIKWESRQDPDIELSKKINHQIKKLTEWYTQNKESHSFTDLQSALVERRLGFLHNHEDSPTKHESTSFYLTKAGNYLTDTFRLGHKYHAIGLDTLFIHFMLRGPQSEVLRVAERAATPQNIEAYAVGVMSKRPYPLCSAKLEIFTRYSMALRFDPKTNKKRYMISQDLLDSTESCVDKEMRAHLLHEYAGAAHIAGDYQTAFTAYKKLLNEYVEGDNPILEIIYRKGLAFVLRAMGRTTEAIVEIKIALEKSKQTGVDRGWEKDIAYDYSRIAQSVESVSAEKIILDLLPHEQSDSDRHRFFERLSYIYEQKNKNDEAILLQKIAVGHAYLSYERMLQGLKLGNADFSDLVTDLFEGSFRRLERLLVNQGRIAEADEVMSMLKASELIEFTRRAGTKLPVDSPSRLTAREQPWMARYKRLSRNLVEMGEENRKLQSKAKHELLDAEKKRQQELNTDLEIAQSAFKAFLDDLHDEFSKQGVAREREITESSEKNLIELQNTLKNLGNNSVFLRFYILEDRVDAILTTTGMQQIRRINIDAKTLNQKIFEFRSLLRAPDFDPKPLAQELYRILIEPLASDLEQAGAKTVMLSLDRNLRYLPFAALHDGQRYLIERWNLSVYLEVSKGNLLNSRNEKWHVAGFGLTRSIGGYPQLPAVRQELQGIVQLSKGWLSSDEIYLDNKFTAKRLRDVGQRGFPVVHIASHFTFSPGTEVNSFLLLGDGAKLTLGDIRTQDFRFKGVDLLTLSACNTALGGGRDETGREIDGFADLMLRQGAKAVMASLWPVIDGSSTALLMHSFYSFRSKKGLNKAEALRQAQLTLISGKHTRPRPAYAPDPAKPYAHPFFWAPFVLMGNWL